MMIDWLTCRIGLPKKLPAHIVGGHQIRVDEDGHVERSFPLRKSVAGSFESSLTVRAPCVYEVEVSGNCAKFLQGHNLYGPSDPAELLWATLQRLEALGIFGCSLADIGLSSRAMMTTCTRVSRVDCTSMLMAETMADVLGTLRHLRVNGRLRNRGRSGLPQAFERGHGVTFGAGKGKTAQHRSITFYSKGEETRLPTHRIADVLANDSEVMLWVDRSLRCEVRLGAKYLAKTGLRELMEWDRETAAKEWMSVMERVDTNGAQLRPETVDDLPDHLRLAFGSWRSGEDLKSILPHRKFYRYRRAILEAVGVDIAIPMPKEPTSNVVPFREVIRLEPAGRPPWAVRIDRELRAQGATVFG